MGRAVDIIKGSLTMRDIFAKYGFEQNRAGFIVCPFHSEKTASLGTYANDKRWKCFGCGAGGDVISFVMNWKSWRHTGKSGTAICCDTEPVRKRRKISVRI